jgi:tripeptide aminopeptidase
MALLAQNSAYGRVTALAGQRPVHAAFAWLRRNAKRIMDWQAELVAIPAPPFGEQARAEWLAERFQQAGLAQVRIDAAGNVLGLMRAESVPEDRTGPLVVLSAHLDTVFPAGTPLSPALDDLDGSGRLQAPGACDNAAGVVGMLAIAHALREARIELPTPLLFVGNVGEEGEGDLRGVRQLYADGVLGVRIAAHIVLDGAGADSAVTQALGSRRYRVRISGPGGHSFTDAGTPNPIAALASALAVLTETELPAEPRTTLNLGTIQGGTSVNSIPESAAATVDFRSISVEQLVRLEVALHRAVEDAVERANALGAAAKGRSRGPLSFQIEKIGDRPGGALADDSPLLGALRAVDRHLGMTTELRLGSTDANIPLSLGVQAISLGAGGEGGGAHTQAEWYSAKDRDLGLKRVLLLTLAMVVWAAER